MINFRRIEIEDIHTVREYVFGSTRRNCDLTFANLYSWRFLYLTEIAEHEGFLLIKFYLDGEPAYMLPVGNGNLKKVIEDLIEDSRKSSFPFRMFGVCADNISEIEEAFPGKFDITLERNYSDYIYLRSDLASLQGKKFQPKRNHINKFRKAYPHYEFRPLTEDLVAECLRLEAIWCHANDCSENEALQNERKCMNVALRNLKELDITGGVLFVDGNIAGFTYGSPLNDNTFDTCVEKADTSYEGAYAIVNNEFANMLPEQYTYINREEDLGLEGLRKAKLSYQPTVILEKYMLEFK